MEELRADLERAVHVGGPGHYSERVVGPFKLGIVLGRGAIGEVYEATHVATGAEAAVKVQARGEHVGCELPSPKIATSASLPRPSSSPPSKEPGTSAS